MTSTGPDERPALALLGQAPPECGADARAGERGGIQDLWTEDYQAWLYERQLEILGACGYIKGMSPWILYDFRCPRRSNRFQEGFNRKGLIDADRQTKKLAFQVLAAFYSRLSEPSPPPRT